MAHLRFRRAAAVAFFCVALFALSPVFAGGSREESRTKDPGDTVIAKVPAATEVVVTGEIGWIGSEPHSRLCVRVHRGETTAGEPIQTDDWVLAITGPHHDTLDARHQSEVLTLTGILIAPPGSDPGDGALPGSGVLEVSSFSPADE